MSKIEKKLVNSSGLMFSLDSTIIPEDVDGGGMGIIPTSWYGGVSPFLLPGAKATESEDTIFVYPERLEREREREIFKIFIKTHSDYSDI